MSCSAACKCQRDNDPPVPRPQVRCLLSRPDIRHVGHDLRLRGAARVVDGAMAEREENEKEQVHAESDDGQGQDRCHGGPM